MTKIEPNGLFEVWRADEAAECLDGVFAVPGLYEALWNIVDKQKPIPNIEDSGPADHIGHEALADHWADLTEDQQAKLNELAEAQDRKFEEWRKQDERRNEEREIAQQRAAVDRLGPDVI